MSDYKEYALRLRTRMSEPVDWKLYTDAADAIENLSAQLEAEEATNDRLRDEIADAVGARERMAAEVERWRDPESDERQKLQEEIIFSLGDGARSEVELREDQLDVTEAALALARAEVDRLKQERDEALAARETYAMTARQDIIEKAKALDELDAWLREKYDSYAEIEVDSPGALVRLLADGPNAERFGRAPTLAAAIRAALEKARGA